MFRDDALDAGETREAEEDASAEAVDESTLKSNGDNSSANDGHEDSSDEAPPDDVQPHEEEKNKENADVPDQPSRSVMLEDNPPPALITIQFQPGPLGMNVVPVISVSSKSSFLGCRVESFQTVSQARELGVAHNDTLVKVGDTDVTGMPHRAIIAMLQRKDDSVGKSITFSRQQQHDNVKEDIRTAEKNVDTAKNITEDEIVAIVKKALSNDVVDVSPPERNRRESDATASDASASIASEASFMDAERNEKDLHDHSTFLCDPTLAIDRVDDAAYNSTACISLFGWINKFFDCKDEDDEMYR